MQHPEQMQNTPDITTPDPESTDALTVDEADAEAISAVQEEEEVEGDFLSSLRAYDLTATAPLSSPPQKSKQISPFFLVRMLLLVLCLAVLFYSGRLLIAQAKDSITSLGTYGDISNQFWGNTSSALLSLNKDAPLVPSPDYQASQTMTDFDQIIKPPVYNAEFEKIKAKLGALKEINPEIFGYIYIDGTSVDYPLVKHADNDYYLNHDFTGKYSSAGSIYVDYRCDDTIEENRNTVIYGHHMYSGSTMFHTLDYFFDEDFFKEHSEITVYTFDGIYRFTVFATYITKMDYHYIRTHFSGDAAYVDWCKEMQANSLFYREGISFDKDSHIITLSTCTNIVKTDRICIQAVLTSVER